MSTYATSADMIKLYGEDSVRTALPRELDNAAQDVVLDDAAGASQVEIDSYLSAAGYVTPVDFDDPATPDKVEKMLTEDTTALALCRVLPISSGPREKLEERCRVIRAFYRRLPLVIAGLPKPAAATREILAFSQQGSCATPVDSCRLAQGYAAHGLFP